VLAARGAGDCARAPIDLRLRVAGGDRLLAFGAVFLAGVRPRAGGDGEARRGGMDPR